jgi:hypothetical protein
MVPIAIRLCIGNLKILAANNNGGSVKLFRLYTATVVLIGYIS